VNAGNGNATNGVYYKLMNDLDMNDRTAPDASGALVLLLPAAMLQET